MAQNSYLKAESFDLEVTDWWISGITGIDYPAGWRITIPEIDLELTGKPMMNNQEVLVFNQLLGRSCSV